MLVFWMITVGVGSILSLDDRIVATVVKDCVAKFVVLEELCTVDVLVCSVEMLGENDGGGMRLEIVGKVVDMFLPVEELWSVAVIICCVKLLVEVFAVVVGWLILEGETRPAECIVGALGMLVEKVAECVAI